MNQWLLMCSLIQFSSLTAVTNTAAEELRLGSLKVKTIQARRVASSCGTGERNERGIQWKTSEADLMIQAS